MRRNLLHFGYKELHYEIREIVAVAEEVASFGRTIYYENIGDPVAKGEFLPAWMKDIIKDALSEDSVYGYAPSKGLKKTREYIASHSHNTTPDDIIFFNGLGEAINKIYGYLDGPSRVLGPSPAYPTHSSSEAVNSGSDHLTYTLDPYNHWNPNLEEIENKVRYNPNIVAILVINPDNPTGAVFDREVLEGIISIAKRYNLFVIFDEIYEKLVFDAKDHILLSEIIGDVPGISMKGVSKELPWPGARCGWIEVYNADKDENFRAYINSIYMSKMLEVCSTTLPQYVIPIIYEDARFAPYLAERIQNYKARAEKVGEVFGRIPGVVYNAPKAAYYVSIVLEPALFDLSRVGPVSNPDLERYIQDKLVNIGAFDKRFCYLLLAHTGICVVPLSGFNALCQGFRMTLLEDDLEKFDFIIHSLEKFIRLIHR